MFFVFRYFPWVFLKEIGNIFFVFLSSYRNTRESLGELAKAEETLACSSCSHSIFRSPKLPLPFYRNTEKAFYFLINYGRNKLRISFFVFAVFKIYSRSNSFPGSGASCMLRLVLANIFEVCMQAIFVFKQFTWIIVYTSA